MFKPKTPYLAVDGIIEVYDEKNVFEGIVLIQRKFPPLGLAIPGGFMDIGESAEDALVREMKEETTLNVSNLKLLNVYSDPKRDSRFHVVSLVYICQAVGIPQGSDDAKEAYIYKIEDLPLDKLVFDHKDILQDYFRYKKL
jgi:8-oxo-dGTP diphosphatase